jgi:hypothetical protein
MAHQSKTHGTLVSYEDSMPKESRQIFSPRYYVNRVHNQYNKDDYLSYKTKLSRVVPTPDESKQANQAYARPIPGYSTWMRVHIHSTYLRLFNLDERKNATKPTLALS